MGNVKWTTPAEEKFLLTNVPQYEAAQAAKQVHQYLQSFDLIWLLKFPEYSDGRNPTPLVVLKKRIRSWFNNHTGVRAKLTNPVAKIRTGGKAPRIDPIAGILMGGGLNRPKQKLQPKQAYAVMLRDSTAKADIEAEWKDKLVAEPGLANKKGAFLNYLSMRFGQKYDAESDETKAQVETFREEEHQRNLQSSQAPSLLLPHEKDLPDEEKELLYEARTTQRALDNMRYACEYFSEIVHNYSKANVVVLVVGPEPKRNGILSVTQVSAGTRVSDGKDIFAIHPDTVSRMTNQLKSFTKSCITTETIDAIKLAYPSHVAHAPSQAAVTPDESQRGNTITFATEGSVSADSSGEGASSSLPNKIRFTKGPGNWKRHALSPTGASDLEVDDDQLSGMGSSDEEDEENEVENSNQARPTVPDPSSPSSPSLKIIERKGGSGEFGRVKLVGGAWISNYEYTRLVQIGKNKQFLSSLKIGATVQAITGPALPPSTPQRHQRARILPMEPSRVPPGRASKTNAKSYRIPGLTEFDDGGEDLIDLDMVEAKMTTFERRFDDYDHDMELSAPFLRDENLGVEAVGDCVPTSGTGAHGPSEPETSPPPSPLLTRGDDAPDALPSNGTVPESRVVDTHEPLTAVGLASFDSGPIGTAHATKDGEHQSAPLPLNGLGSVLNMDSLTDLSETVPHEEPAMTPREKAKAASRRNNSTSNIVPGRSTTVENTPTPVENVPAAVEIAPTVVENVPTAVENAPAAVESAGTPIPFSAITASTDAVTQNTFLAKDIHISTVPSRIQEHFEYLRGVLRGRQEIEALFDWLTLECEDEKKAASKLPASFRPKVISGWLRSKSKPGDEIPEFSVADLADEQRKWWMSIMPGWRLAGKSVEADDAWPMSRRIPEGETWQKVRKAGPQGLFLMFFGLALWRTAFNRSQASRREYESFLEDFAWVLHEVVKGMVPFVGRNRPAQSSIANVAAADPATASRRASARVSRPTKRKLGESDLDLNAVPTSRSRRK